MIGWFLHSQQVENVADYVVVFLTTHIVRGANDLQTIYEKRFKEFDPRKPRMVLESEVVDQKKRG